MLIVDDDSDLRSVLVDKFSSEGFDVESAQDGEEGLEKAFTFHPDIILLDILMPKMNGWEMLEALRKDSWGEKAKVILLTVLADEEHVSQALERGEYQYLVKTDWSLDDVVTKVNEIVG